jgi:hypothetical protein
LGRDGIFGKWRNSEIGSGSIDGMRPSDPRVRAVTLLDSGHFPVVNKLTIDI